MSDLTITDNRTGDSFEAPIADGAIRATALRQAGLLSYDPGLLNTATVRSAITFVDGERGILRYRGYPIEQLAEESTYVETAYLLLNGELPTADGLHAWEREIAQETALHESIRRIVDGFPYDAHPMGMFVSLVAALGTLYPEASNVDDADVRLRQVVRLIAKVPVIAAWSYRHTCGEPSVPPDRGLSFTENVLAMLFKQGERTYAPEPVLARALEVLFILHADHEQNCSTNAMRAIGSSRVDPYSALAGAAAALYGPLHGGANEAVLRMLAEIGDVENVPDFIASVKAKERLLMGFGHRVYKNYDPRAAIIKRTADAVFDVTGRNPLLDIALELERIALEDEYFVTRRLYPNVDFYSGLIYQALGLPATMFTVMFAVARTSGWLAQWLEGLVDPEQAIARPRQIYIGPDARDYVPVESRGDAVEGDLGAELERLESRAGVRQRL